MLDIPILLQAKWITAGQWQLPKKYKFGIISNKPYDDVNEAPKLPALTAPCNAAAAPNSDYVYLTVTTLPKALSLP